MVGLDVANEAIRKDVDIARSVRRGGTFVLADAIRNEEDKTDFINRFQELKPDGHVRMHRSEEYDELLVSTPQQVPASYGIRCTREEIHLRLRILNAAFVNR